jgi:putative transposase
LTYIRSRTTVGPEQRDRHSKWAFAKLRDYITYKAKREGVPLIIASITCPECGYVDEHNRKADDFKCLKCGYAVMADYAPALNIRTRALVNEPMVTPLAVTKAVYDRPLILISGN